MQKKHCTLVALALVVCLIPGASLAFGPQPTAEPFFFQDFDSENLMDADNNVTPEHFQDAYITLVNFWATWCPPCVAELPELARLSQESDGLYQVMGVLIDSVDQFGRRDGDAIEAMELLMADAEATYPVVPGDEYWIEYFSSISVVPTTMVVDREGRLITVIQQAMDLEGWIAVCDAAAEQVYGEIIAE